MASKINQQTIPGTTRQSRFQNVEHAKNPKETLKRIVVYFLKEKKWIYMMLIIVGIGTLCGVLAPAKQSEAIDLIASKNTGKLLTSAILMMFFYYFIYSISSLFQSLISAKLSQNVVERLRDDLFSKILDLPISYIDEHSHGDLMSRMTNDIENISTTVSTSLASLVSGALTILGTAFMMFYYCWQLALLSLITIFLTIFATQYLSKKVRKYSGKRQRLMGNLNGMINEMITGYRSVVAYNHQIDTLNEFEQTADELTKAGILTDCFSGVMGPVMNCIGNIGFVIIAIFGGYFSLHGLISVGIISAFIVYAKQFSKPINEIAQVYGQLQTAIACFERLIIVLDEQGEKMDGEEVKTVKQTGIDFNHVDFSYNADHKVIDDFTLHVPSGRSVALVGATGSGKTTIVNLIMRYYEHQSGSIMINDQDLKAISKKSLREHVAIVLQDTVLFSDTLLHNLTYDYPEASDEDIQRAIKATHLDHLINRLPDGLNTVLVGAGSNLSAGERQLIAIARAFISDPDILILDEATSNVDTRTEKQVQDAMNAIMSSRTSIIIAHRLSTIQNADMIVVMDHGKIVEQGNHKELLALKKRYYQLYHSQYSGFAI